MRHQARVLDQALHPAEALAELPDPGCLDHRPRGLLAPVELEAHHPAEIAHLPSGELVLRVIGQAGVMNPTDRFVLGEPRRDSAGVLAVLAHSQRQGLETAEHEPGVERPRHCTQCVLQEGEALRERAVGYPDETSHHVGMAAEVLRRRMHDEIGAESQRPLQKRGGERVVDDAQSAGRAGGIGGRGDVDDVEERIRRRLDPDHPRPRVEQLREPLVEDVHRRSSKW